MDTKKIYRLLIVFTCVFVVKTTHAQVYVKFPDLMAGTITTDNLYDVRIQNMVFGVDEIHYIFKTYLLDETQSDTLFAASTGTLINKRGNTNFSREKANGLVIEKDEINLEQYTGKLILVVEMVHPLDNWSIIARDTKIVQLKNGVFIDQTGKPIVDESKVSINYSNKLGDFSDNSTVFKVRDLLDKLIINNPNTAAACIDLQFTIRDFNKELYQANLATCVVPGESQLNEVQKKQIQLIKDEYSSRHPLQNISISVSVKQASQRKYYETINYKAHSRVEDKLVSYHSKSLPIAFDYYNFSECRALVKPDAGLVIFNENGQVKTTEILTNTKPLQSVLGIDSPYGFNMFRNEVNGRIMLSVLPLSTFTKQEWTAYINYMTDVQEKQQQLLTFSNEVFTITAAPEKKLFAQVEDRQYESYIVSIAMGEQMYLLNCSRIISQGESFNKRYTKQIDTKQVLNSLIVNGFKLNFTFDKNGIVTAIDAKKIDKPQSTEAINQNIIQYLKYEKVAEMQGIVNNSYLSSMGVESPNFNEIKDSVAALIPDEHMYLPSFLTYYINGDNSQQYEKKQLTAIDIGLQIRKNDQLTIGNKPTYTYQQYNFSADSTVNSRSEYLKNINANSKNPMRDGFELKLPALKYEIDNKMADVTVRRIDTTISNAGLIQSIVRYENQYMSQISEVIEETTKEWTLYTPNKLTNQTIGVNGGIFLVFFNQKNYYFIKARCPFTTDLKELLNTLTIGDQSFYFTFDAENNITKITVQ